MHEREPRNEHSENQGKLYWFVSILVSIINKLRGKKRFEEELSEEIKKHPDIPNYTAEELKELNEREARIHYDKE